jgi:hypothetical protein
MDDRYDPGVKDKDRDRRRYPQHVARRRPAAAAKPPTPIDAARTRMLDAYSSMRRDRTDGTWPGWQSAAVDYYLLRHPEARSLRRPAAGHVPTVDELVDRANALNALRRALDEAPPDDVDRVAATGWFHELNAGLYGPVGEAMVGTREGDRAGVEILVRFLEADVYCFGSGYGKGDVVDVLKRLEFDLATARRLRQVVLAIVDGYDRREFRVYIRLARAVDSPELRESLQVRLDDVSPKVRRHARWMLDGLQP